ncbi:hypothetical protein [Algoriphagus terrigena]|uniref:hypothetical protein n=1 Tax=Algoriphagus terrigena TaxID=344884 RepID=UPI000412F8ED|nr:hypothetical protein [Algoriphagus terrigena]
MKWTYSIPRKTGTALLLLTVLVLVLANNLRDRSNSERLKTAFESIYEDRLMVESYILRLSEELHQIQEILENPVVRQTENLQRKLSEIEQINLLYLNTELTKAEEMHFEHFEKLTWELDKALLDGKIEGANSKIEEALMDLRLLSEIQISEGQSLLTQSQQLFKSSSISSQFEICLVIILGLMVQGILFASKTLQKQNSISTENLN